MSVSITSIQYHLDSLYRSPNGDAELFLESMSSGNLKEKEQYHLGWRFKPECFAG